MIYGIDYGSRRIAIAGPDDCLAVLRLSPPRTGKTDIATPGECQLLAGFVAAVVPPGSIIYVERPMKGRVQRNIRTAIRLGMSAGAILARHAGSGHLVDPAVWKAAVVGSGNADKTEIATWLAREDPARAEACAGDQDLIDACAIRRYGELDVAARLAPGGELPRRAR